MRKSCLVIGVGRTDGLAKLPGAANAAKDFATWADCAGYDQVEMVCDSYRMNRSDTGLTFEPVSQKVTAGQIRDALLTLVPTPKSGEDKGGPPNPPDRLIVFFAGHGIIKTAGQDYWIMSDSLDSREAILAPNLIAQLREYFTFRHGQQALRPQISIISDCCQVVGDDLDTFTIQPAGSLPRGPFDPAESLPIYIETLKAVPELREAYMLPEHGASPARCIFSSVLIEALSGKVRDANRRCVNYQLATYLETEVPKKAIEYDVEMVPQYLPMWVPDDNAYCEDPPGSAYPELPPWPDFDTDPAPQGDNDDAGGEGRRENFAVGMGPQRQDLGRAKRFRGRAPGSANRMAEAVAPVSRSSIVRSAVEIGKARAAKVQQEAAAVASAIAETDLLDYSPTGCGIGIAGARAVEIVTSPETCIENAEGRSDSWIVGECEGEGILARHRKVERSTWALIELEYGNFVGSCTMPEFVTDCFVDAKGCRSMYFRGNGFGMSPWADSRTVLERLLSRDLHGKEALELAVGMRHSKHQNPILGVIAAYLYNSLGDIESIRKMAAFYAKRRQFLPFEIAMLGMIDCEADGSGEIIARVPETEAREARTEQEKQYTGYFGATKACSLPVVGRFPLLSVGWPLLGDRLPSSLRSQDLATVTQEIVADAPFTTLTAAGGRRLLDILLG